MTNENKFLKLLREFTVEFTATTFLLVLGLGCGCVEKFNGGASGGIAAIAGWGLAVLFAVTLSGGITGGHLNPAVSFAFALSGDLPWYKFPIYCTAQILGAFLGSCIIFGIYYDAFNAFDGGFRAIEGDNGTAALFATYPRNFVSSGAAFSNEVFATALLLLLVMAVIDTENMKIPRYLMPSMIGMVIVLLNCSLCYNSGCAMNPARDLGPRIFTSLAGWGSGVFSYRNWNWFWVPLLGPMIGGPLGLYAYKILISFQISTRKESAKNSQKINSLHDSDLQNFAHENLHFNGSKITAKKSDQQYGRGF